MPLLRAAGSTQAGQLPDPFPGLANSRYKVHFRRSQLCMLAGPPGAGKTMIALIAALRANVPCLYVSADSDEWTMAARAAAAITKHPVHIVEETIKYGMFPDEYGPQVEKLPVRFIFQPSEPSVEDLAHALTAWLEIQGHPPHLIVVDNLMNLRGEHGDEWTAMRQTCKDLHWLARMSKACVLVLHHTSEQNSSYITSAPPRGAIQGKVAQLPSLILTTANNSLTGELWVAVAKNRHGVSDPHAQNPLRWIVDFIHCQIYDTPMRGSVLYDTTYEQDDVA